MSVVLEFTIEAEQFTLGSVLSEAGDLAFELEKIVPTGTDLLPFVWVATDRDVPDVLPDFEESIRNNTLVRDLYSLDRLEDGGLYRIEWEEVRDDSLLNALATAEGTVLDAWGSHTWNFRVRFTDTTCLEDFQNSLRESAVSIHIERMYVATRENSRRWSFGLTADEREALELALHRGYFETPRQANLAELGDELGITKQSVSDRIRRGNKKILQNTLDSSSSN